MPALGSITIHDGAATPVAHVFSPQTTTGSKATLLNRTASIPRGFESLNLELVKPAQPTAAYRIIGSITLPTVGPVDGQDQVIRQNKLDFTLNLSQDSTLQDRKNAVALLANLLDNATVRTMVENLEPLY